MKNGFDSLLSPGRNQPMEKDAERKKTKNGSDKFSPYQKCWCVVNKKFTTKKKSSLRLILADVSAAKNCKADCISSRQCGILGKVFN